MTTGDKSGKRKRKRAAKAGEKRTAKKRSPLFLIGQAAFYVVAVGALLRGLELVVGNAMTVALLGAVGVSLFAARVGVMSEEGGARARRRALLAAGYTLGVVCAAVIAAVALGGSLDLIGPSLPSLFGIAESGALAYRDELWLHGIAVVFALRARVPRWAIFLFGVAASVAVVALRPGASLVNMLLTAASAGFFVLLWLRTRDAWAPVAAHFTWAWCSESMLNGDLFDMVSPAGRIARGLGASGTVAWVATGGFVVLCALLYRKVIHIEPAELDELPAS